MKVMVVVKREMFISRKSMYENGSSPCFAISSLWAANAPELVQIIVGSADQVCIDSLYNDSAMREYKYSEEERRKREKY